MLKYPRMDPFERHRLGLTRHDPRADFRRQVRLQVYLPLAIGLLALIGAVAALWRGQVGDASAWADTALAFLLLLVMLLGLVALALFSAVTVGVWFVVRELPQPFEQARTAVARAEHAVDQAYHKAALPLIVPKAAAHSIAAGIRYLAGIFGRAG